MDNKLNDIYNTNINHSSQFKCKNPQSLTYDPISLFLRNKRHTVLIEDTN